MKNERIKILQKVANGELTPEQADDKLLSLSIFSHRRELLIAFEQWRRVQGFFANATATFKIVDEYLEIN